MILAQSDGYISVGLDLLGRQRFQHWSHGEAGRLARRPALLSCISGSNNVLYSVLVTSAPPALYVILGVARWISESFEISQRALHDTVHATSHAGAQMTCKSDLHHWPESVATRKLTADRSWIDCLGMRSFNYRRGASGSERLLPLYSLDGVAGASQTDAVATGALTIACQPTLALHMQAIFSFLFPQDLWGSNCLRSPHARPCAIIAASVCRMSIRQCRLMPSSSSISHNTTLRPAHQR